MCWSLGISQCRPVVDPLDNMTNYSNDTENLNGILTDGGKVPSIYPKQFARPLQTWGIDITWQHSDNVGDVLIQNLWVKV